MTFYMVATWKRLLAWRMSYIGGGAFGIEEDVNEAQTPWGSLDA
jgi:hypothetical protein